MEEIAAHDQDRSLEEHTWHFNHSQRLSQSLTLCVIIPAPGFMANVRLCDLNWCAVAKSVVYCANLPWQDVWGIMLNLFPPPRHFLLHTYLNTYSEKLGNQYQCEIASWYVCQRQSMRCVYVFFLSDRKEPRNWSWLILNGDFII